MPLYQTGEEYLLSALESRIREKCITCEELRNDFLDLSKENGSVFEVLPIVLNELMNINQKLESYGRSFEIKEEMFDTLVCLSTSLKLVLDVDKISYKGLVAFTSGSSFGFNRAFALLADKRKLIGHFAIGPRDRKEALRIWKGISYKKMSMSELLEFSPRVFNKEKDKFREILQKMEFRINEEPFKKVFKAETSLRISDQDVMPGVLRDYYEGIPFWIIPLFSHLRRPLGAILLDNFLTRKELTHEEVKALDIFAMEISLALERGLTYEELEEKVETLEEANVKLKEHQELITKLRAEASIGDMVLQLTHSFKNPVIAIAGLARILKKRAQTDLTMSRYIDPIFDEAVKLEKTLKNFVDFTKTRYWMDKSQLDINNVIELLYQEKKTKGKQQNINFHLKLSENLPAILGNEYQLYTCVENIVNNSLEAMPKGGELFIETNTQNGSISLEINDTGPGISEEVMEYLFTPFFTTKTIGSGLGLYTSKEIIENMGGTISVSCVRNKGCKVTIYLPYFDSKENHEQNISRG